ncbi:MAG: hypothetical protein KC940_13180 [Candidatus Omnitrophica bacterium]|nr:hypothetical protein [Candidatus Omnitrophota bacterium]MCA9425838.1 hypothetical protein [Candidatus Omnitrophota bacterium]MCA9431458.1 hypothetical protein [Candidatus Omnitrophota bacterium]MCB9768452.1 hypothetical protein [Candidatus Omnitrophota bacterium]MCB9784471.1 hypothetical protein [Candidatus Omnitrophota bacterium]
MRFSDLLPGRAKHQVGQVISAEWDPNRRGIRFTIQFQPSSRRLEGFCASGHNPVTGKYIDERDLKNKIENFIGLPVYEHALGGDPNKMGVEDFKKLKIELTLTDMHLSVKPASRPVDSNTFISRIFR